MKLPFFGMVRLELLLFHKQKQGMTRFKKTSFKLSKLIFQSSLITLYTLFSASSTKGFGLGDILPDVNIPKVPREINEEINDVIEETVDEIIPYGIPRSTEDLVDLLFNALEKDYGVVQQTPYSAGYNEVLIVSPSTGAEQRMQINLPDDEFRIYQIEFNGVSVPKPKSVVGGESRLQESYIKESLSKFTVEYNDENKVKVISLSDGTKAEFTNNRAIIFDASGKNIETINLSQANRNSLDFISLKSTEKNQCTIDVKQSLENTLNDVDIKNLNLAQLGTSDEARMLAWAGTFGREGLADSLSPDSRNQTIQSISCDPPVKCNTPHTYNGKNEVHTNLFKIPPGIDPEVSLEYEFYTIPDRLEIFYEGSRIFGIGPKSGNNTKRIGNLPDNARYVGVKVIGNRDEGTRWRYTIKCSNTGIEAPLKFVGTWIGHITRQDGFKLSVNIKVTNEPEVGEATGILGSITSRGYQCTMKLAVKTATDSSIVLTKNDNEKCDIDDISLNLVSPNKLQYTSELPSIWQGSLYKENIPCDNEPSFRLNDHLYLDNYIDVFVEPKKDDQERISANDTLRNYPVSQSNLNEKQLLRDRYHYYSTIPNNNLVQYNKVCEIDENGCTPENVFNEMMSETRFTAPARREQESSPVSNCMIVDLNVKGLGDDVARGFRRTDKVVIMVDKSKLIAINYTLPTHTLYPGRILRQVIEKDGAIWVSTIGEGRGNFAEINEEDGLKIFSEEIDYPFKLHIRQLIYKNIPWGLENNH